LTTGICQYTRYFPSNLWFSDFCVQFFHSIYSQALDWTGIDGGSRGGRSVFLQLCIRAVIGVWAAVWMGGGVTKYSKRVRKHYCAFKDPAFPYWRNTVASLAWPTQIFFFTFHIVFHFKVSFGDLGAKSCSRLCIFINYWIENLFYEKVNNRKSWMINNLMSRY
jgi:hypothetical protein